MLALGRRAGRVFAHDRTVFDDGLCQRAVARWIDDVRAGGDHRDGGLAGIQRGAVGGGINAIGQAAGDDQARARQGAGKIARIGNTAVGRIAAANDGDLREPQPLRIPLDEQRRRGTRGALQQRGEVGAVAGHQMTPGGIEPGAVGCQTFVIGLGQPRDGGCRRSGGPELRAIGSGNGLDRAEVPQKLPDTHTAKAGRADHAQPGIAGI